jgi:multidrug resistance efflux pump
MVILYLLNANRIDRKEYQEAIDRAEARADAAELRRVALEARMDGLQQAVDEARAARRAAEDTAALAERELDRHRPGGAL